MIPARGRRGLSSPRPGLLGLGASGAAVPGCRSSAGTRRPSPATNGAWGCGEMSCAGRASLFWPKQFGGASRMHRCIPAPTTPPPPTAHDAGERKATRTLFSVEGCVLLPVEVLSLWSRSGRTRPWARAHVTCASSTRSFPLGASSRQVRHGGFLCAAGGACGGAP